MPGPTDLEQLLLEYVNAARLNPLGDAAHYVNGYTPLTSPDPRVQSAINFFGVSGPAFFAQMSALTPTPPLAWNDSIAAASRAHSQAMINADSQSHQLPGEPGFGDRVTNAGYNFSSLGENIFAFAQSMLYGHAGFMIDWGAGSDGMQTPAGHRLNIMNSTFREIGIGVVADANPATAVGPYVITEDLGRALNGPSVLLLGVAYNDTDNNNFYSLGEGRGGLSINAAGVSTTSTSSGGYAMGVAAGVRTVTVSGGSLTAPLVFTADLANATNAKFDVVGQSTLLTSSSITLVSGVDTVRGLGATGLTIMGSGRDESFIGTSGNDVLNGAAGNDTLDGGVGADALVGGPGNDVYLVDNAMDRVTEHFGEGVDTVMSSITYVLPANVDNLTLIGSASIDATGNGLDNTITGNAGNNTLFGDLGADTLIGGAGNDTYIIGDVDTIVDSAGIDAVQTYIPWTLAAGLENLTLLGSAAFGVGNASNNVITGNDADNPLLRGDGGADVIFGGAGNDWIDGDSGNNLLPVGQTAGNDTVDGGAGDDTVLGGDGDDQISGGDGTDVLVGEGGNDLMYGQADIDYLDGRQGNDQLFGGDGNDILFGDGLATTYGFGSDTLHGENGDDIIMGESGDHNAPGALDVLYGDDGNDLIYGGAGDDYIYGGNGADIIDGGAGNDVIVGGAGADILVGSGDSSNVGGPAATLGNDLFVYTAMADAGDTIYGFDTRLGNTDGIDLRPLFDALGYTGNAARADGWLTVTTGNTPADAVIWVDANGGGNSYVPLLAVAGVAPAALTDSLLLIQ